MSLNLLLDLGSCRCFWLHVLCLQRLLPPVYRGGRLDLIDSYKSILVHSYVGKYRPYSVHEEYALAVLDRKSVV